MAPVTNYGSTITFAGVTIGKGQVHDYPEVLTAKVDVTNHGSGGVAEFIPSGLVTLGEITLSILLESGIFSAIKTYITNKTTGTVVISGGGVDTMTFTGFFLSIKRETADATSPDADKATVVIAATGGLTLS